MPATAIKICGLSTAPALAAALDAGASHVGLVFFPKSPRHVSAAQAAALGAQAAGRACRVGVFVDPDDGFLAEAVTAARLDAIQLHGAETPPRVAAISAAFALPVWKAVSVRTADDVTAADRYNGAAALILFDAKTPEGSALPGGMGLRFDWGLLRHWRGAMPWGLSGGLGPDNVVEALAATRAPLVDVSSGVESAAGVKDMDKIKAFCQSVRLYDQP